MGRRPLRPGDTTETFTFRLPSSDRDALDALGVFHGTSAAAEVRTAIDRYLDSHGEALAERERRIAALLGSSAT